MGNFYQTIIKREKVDARSFLTKEQILDLFPGWILDPEQPKDWIRLDKGVENTDDTVCHLYFFKLGFDLYKFDRIDFD